MPCYTSINARKARTRLSVIKAKILEERSYLCNKCAFSNKYLLSFYYLNSITTYPRLGRIKGKIISECPYEKIVCPKIATKKFLRFLPWPLRRGQIKNFIKPIMLNNP